MGGAACKRRMNVTGYSTSAISPSTQVWRTEGGRYLPFSFFQVKLVIPHFIA